MTSLQKAISAYGQAVETVAPAKQIVMLYDGVLRQIATARLAIVERRINDRFMAVQKATLILEALQGCLDFDKGGDIAPQLDRLYNHYIFRLQAINVDDDPKICDELTGLISELRDSWSTIATQGGAAPAAAPPGDPSAAPSPVTA